MKNLIITLIAISSYGSLYSQNDWNNIPVPANAGVGKVWELQPMSDNFNYSAPATNKGTEFLSKWTDFYHNAWAGPGLTVWNRGNSLVSGGLLQMTSNRVPNTNKLNLGCITSKERVIYPVYVEARAKIMNAVLANAVWLLSPDDTQEIDLLEAYGSSFSESAQKDQTWFAQRIHVSHHVFIRNPFQDYQPTDAGSWYTNGTTLWRNDFHRYGVYWKDPWNLEYYIDGQLVRTVSGKDIIDPRDYTGGTGLNKAMDIIINAEDQDWRSGGTPSVTPTDTELANTDNHTFKVDWIRIYKPVNATGTQELSADTAQLFPNPSSDFVHIQSPKRLKQLYVSQMNGALVKTEKIDGTAKSLSVSDLDSGSYILKIQYEDGTVSFHKVMKF